MTLDPYQLSTEVEGRLERRDLPGGQCEAKIRVTPEGIHALTDSNEHVILPMKRLRLSRAEDGALVATSASAGCSVASLEEDFLRAVEAAGGNDLANQVARLAGQKVSSTGQEVFGCLLVLTMVLGALWAIPRVFRRGIDATVGALPYSVDRTLGEAAQDNMESAGAELDDPVLREAVQKMLDRIAPHCGTPSEEQVFTEGEGWADSEWGFEFRIVDNPVSNAFALPGGYITIHSGLIAESTTPEQVAAVLAHEIAHVTQRHGLRRVAHSVGMMAGVSLIFGGTGGLEGIALDLFTLSSVNGYSQEQETDADSEGVRLLIAAGIDPSGLAEFFASMRDEHGDVPDALSWASTHPQFDVRIAALDEALAAAEAAGQVPDAWTPLGVDWDAVQEALPKH
ncbi:MAG: hypothetical protein ACI8QC_000426 [Planctomycetota bacterium]|jgi:hypothetical protein